MSHLERQFRHVPRLGLLAASVAALFTTGGLWAQDQDDETPAAAREGDEIVVTGTRIRRDDFNAANSTTVVTGQDMQDLGVFSVADMVNQLPNNIGSVTPEATADSPFYLGASIANLRGLNTAYGVRTLTLVDSRRMTPNNNGGGVDMNFIPSALVGRIETVTGGASATYGADAMAGVVNVIIDDNIENMRVSLEYGSTAEGDGDNYNLSFGTGAQFLEGRARLTVGFDSSRQDAIEDCTTREYCARGLGLLRNGSGPTYVLNPGGTQPDGAGRGPDIYFQGMPEWLPIEGHRYTVTTRGVLQGPQYANPSAVVGDPLDPRWDSGWYQFNEAGNDLVPYLTDVDNTELAAINNVGVQVGPRPNGAWATPYGEGRGIYDGQPIRPRQKRDNIFTRFTYDLEGGITLNADLTYGETEAESLQNMSRGNMQQMCVYPWNAYVQAGSELMKTVLLARTVSGVSHGAGDNARVTFGPAISAAGTPVTSPYGTYSRGINGCLQAPYLGGSFQNRPDGTEAALFDFPPGFVTLKDFSEQVDRRNLNKSNAKSLSVSATGPMFEGGSWDWDVFAQFGQTENRQTLSGWRAARRFDMALDSVVDGDGVVRCGVDVQNLPFTDARPGDKPENQINEYGAWVRNKWMDYLFQANNDTLTEAERVDVFNALREGCVPFNPFGSEPLTAEQLAYVFPTLFEGTDNDQTGLSLSFSGDAWKGIGDAGALAMASGFDWRRNDTQNIADPNRFLGADFNFAGDNSSGFIFDRVYGDNWFGRTTTKEAWVEFDLPLLRDRFLAQGLGINTSFRRTQSGERRISGLEGVTTPDAENEIDSWKATLSWQPVAVMRMRATRSADTRAPSAQELYATNSYATESGGQTEIRNPWRFGHDDPAIATEDGDQIIRVQGGNANLEPEVSVTQTLGLVFQPARAIPGLQVSVDYYETTIKGGIERISVNQTISLCEDEIGAWQDGPIPVVPPSEWQFCNNINFGDPGVVDPGGSQQFFLPGAREGGGGLFTTGDLILDENGNPVTPGTPNPYWEYTNIVSVAESAINTEDFVSRGIDYSVSYFTQLRDGSSINARALVTRYLEQSIFDDTFGRIDVSGQTGGNNMTSSFGSFSNNYSPTPRIRGNLFMTYRKNAFGVTAQAEYVGSGRLNIQNGWIGPGDTTSYTRHFLGEPYPLDAPPSQCNALGLEPGCTNPATITYHPHRGNTTADSELPSYTTFNLNFNYDFGSSRALSLDRFESMSLFLNIDNVTDKVPDFFSGTGAGGINTTLFSGMGRTYRMGVRMEF